MNDKRLKQAEHAFFSMYPEGFQSPEMIEMGKKHKMDRHITFAQESFSPSALKNVEEATENMIKLVSRSSMVSLFEKPKFRDAVRSMNTEQKTNLVYSLNELLHGDEEKGFNQMLDILTGFKLAKWTLMTVFRCYYYPQTDLLYKPTTVKNILNFAEIDDLVYRPRPSYEFFYKYRKAINYMKQRVDPSLSTTNAKFSGFLMITMDILLPQQ
jgi:hypothetical protein